MRAPHLYRSLRLFVLGGFALCTRELEEGADLPFAFEEHASPGAARSLRVPPARPAVRRGPGRRLASLADARAALDDLRREPAAQIFARAHAGSGGRRRSAAPQHAAAAPDVGRRALRRLRLDRRDLRQCLPRARAVALQDEALVRGGRAGRRLEAGATVELGRDSACAPPPRVSSPRTGRRRTACSRRTSAASPTGCCARAGADARLRGRRPPGRAGRARGRGQRAPPGDRRRDRRRAGAVRAARLAAERDPPRAADRGHAAAGRGRASTRCAARSRGTCSPGSRPPTRTRSSRRRSTATSSRSSRTSRSGPSSCASRWPSCSAAPRASGRRTSARPSCSGRRRRTAARSSAALRHPGAADGSAPACARRDAPARRPRALVGALDQSLLGLAPRPKPHVAARALAG